MTVQVSWRTVFAATVAALIALVLAPALERAQPQALGGGGGQPVELPPQLPFQARLLNPAAEPVPEGSATMLFSLYEAPTGGTAIWSSRPITVEVKKGGMVNVLLGDAAHPLSAVDFSRPLYVGVRIDDPANATALEREPELLPRVQVLPAPYAHAARDAATLAGRDWRPILAGGNDPETGVIRGDKVDPRYTVPAGAIILWAGKECPKGYRPFLGFDGELNGRFLVAGPAYEPRAGGTKDHGHDPGSYAIPSHQHQFATSGISARVNADPNIRVAAIDGFLYGSYGQQSGAAIQPQTQRDAGGEAIVGKSAPAEHLPPFATILLCQCEER
ncbi:MAG: hypothetical protein HY721_29115 [Planctomycetes bacterium]|nr:hypothetical protein [Planctomycetota bacterium]